ncbi:MAG TPA: tetratricopeptide repeat-containing sensor histidine kinase [Tenuifilaceae bacterium]|nr:tetratricopeptide repeat-containing sensor histidine kinase [Tenuifilaceae bacterium]HPN20698.1 tetratricopeptide repeat-containing sensor histidine kinase [Tenuifilaceae bacterium]
MKRTIKYLPILFSALWISASAQVNSRNAVIDSLTTIANSNKGIIRVTAYDKISRLYWQTNPDSSIYYASLALSEAEKDKSDACYGEAYNSLGNAYSSKGEFEQSIEFYTKSMEHRERSNDMLKVSYSLSNLSFSLQNLKRYSEAMDALKRAASICNSIGNAQDEALINQQIASLYKNLQDLNRALEYALKAVNINLSNNITTGLANNYNFIGLLHKDLKNFDLAEEYFLKSLKIWQQEKNEEGLSNTYNNLGIVYDEKKDAQKALEYYSKSLELSKKLGDLKGIAVAYNNIGFLSIRINQIDAGIDSYLKSIKISHDLNDIESYLNTYNNIAIAYLKKNNIEKSEEYVNLVLKEFDKVNDLAIIQETYKILSDINSKKGNFKKAFEYKTIELAYNDTLYTQQQTSNIIEMQTRFETEAKEREIQILKKDNDIKQLEFERQRFFQRILIIISILFLIILVGGAMSFRYIRRSNKLLEQKNIEFENANIKLIESEKNLRELNATKDKLFSIIAHDLKNPFNALMGFSDLLDKNYNFLSEEERKEYIGVVSDSTQNLYKLLDNLLQWTRTQTGAITYISENFKLYPLIKQEVDILSPNADKKKININLKLDENQIVYADKNSIATVVRNLVSNAIKFTSNGGWIEIDAKQNSKFVEISVSDSGIGIKGDDIDKIFMLDSSFTTKGTANESGTGLGLLLCKEFVEKNNGKIWAESKKGKGSTFYFTLPLA